MHGIMTNIAIKFFEKKKQLRMNKCDCHKSKIEFSSIHINQI